MVLRAADAVVAIHDITNAATGRLIRHGTPGVILKQLGSTPATFRVRFDISAGNAPVVIDEVTDHDIVSAGDDLGDPYDRNPEPTDRYLRFDGAHPTLTATAG